MNCFYHHDRVAVGTCKSCQRGLCPACAVDFPRGIACRARCEEDVEGLIGLIQNNIRLAPTNARFIRASRNGGILAACFYLAAGALFFGFGWRDSFTVIELLGGCFLVFGVVTLIRVLRLTSRLPTDDET